MGKDFYRGISKLDRTPNRTPYDLGHRWQDALKASDDGKMDRFDQVLNGNVSGYLLPYTQMTAGSQ